MYIVKKRGKSGWGIKMFFILLLFVYTCMLLLSSIEVLRLCPKAQDWRWGRNSGIIISFLFRNHETKLTIFKYFSLQAVVSFQKKADSMILEFIFKHQFDLAHWHGLEDFKYNRHNTYFQKKCICQYLEPSLVSDSLL